MSWWTNPNLQPKTKSKFVVVFGGSFYLPNIKSLNKPKVEFDTKEYRLLNHKFNYPGNATWQPITMKFVDMNGMGRSGKGTMSQSPGSVWKIDSQFSGTQDDNFITRALENPVTVNNMLKILSSSTAKHWGGM